LMNNVLAPLTSLVDFFSYSYYPYTGDYVFSDPALAAPQISQMIYMAGGKSVLFQEIGYPSSPLLNSSPDRQAAFLQNTFDALRFYSSQVIDSNFVWMPNLSPSAVNPLTHYLGFSGNSVRDFV